MNVCTTERRILPRRNLWSWQLTVPATSPTTRFPLPQSSLPSAQPLYECPQASTGYTDMYVFSLREVHLIVNFAPDLFSPLNCAQPVRFRITRLGPEAFLPSARPLNASMCGVVYWRTGLRFRCTQLCFALFTLLDWCTPPFFFVSIRRYDCNWTGAHRSGSSSAEVNKLGCQERISVSMPDRISLFAFSFFLFLLQSLVFSFLCPLLPDHHPFLSFFTIHHIHSPTSRFPCLSPFSCIPVFLISLRGLVFPIPIVRHSFHPSWIHLPST